jgi:hypothetical protein
MTRQLFALLALLSGLAALSAPANASPLQALAANVEASAQSERPHSAVVQSATAAVRARTRIDRKGRITAPRLHRSGIHSAPIFIKVDRALE